MTLKIAQGKEFAHLNQVTSRKESETPINDSLSWQKMAIKNYWIMDNDLASEPPLDPAQSWVSSKGI